MNPVAPVTSQRYRRSAIPVNNESPPGQENTAIADKSHRLSSSGYHSRLPSSKFVRHVDTRSDEGKHMLDSDHHGHGKKLEKWQWQLAAPPPLAGW